MDTLSRRSRRPTPRAQLAARKALPQNALPVPARCLGHLDVDVLRPLPDLARAAARRPAAAARHGVPLGAHAGAQRRPRPAHVERGRPPRRRRVPRLDVRRGREPGPRDGAQRLRRLHRAARARVLADPHRARRELRADAPTARSASSPRSRAASTTPPPAWSSGTAPAQGAPRPPCSPRPRPPTSRGAGSPCWAARASAAGRHLRASTATPRRSSPSAGYQPGGEPRAHRHGALEPQDGRGHRRRHARPARPPAA